MDEIFFRYDFLGDKLDLSKFKKQASVQIARYSTITYDLYFADYKLICNIITPISSNSHQVDVFFYSLVRDDWNEIYRSQLIAPLSDDRFQDFKEIVNLFSNPTNNVGHFDSNSVDKTIQLLSDVIKIVYKVNNLKVFL